MGYDRVALVAIPEIELPLAALGQLRLWLDGQPMQAITEARLRALLRIVLILEPKRGLEAALEVLDQPIAATGIRPLLVLAGASLQGVDEIVREVEAAASEF